MATIKAGLIQVALKGDVGDAPAAIRERMVEAHLPFIEKAAIRLLAEVDTALGQRCGPATRAVLRRQYEVFADERFVRLAGLSNGHLYNLRASRTYRTRRSVFTKTRARVVSIGERRKPRPDGQPGFLRVDTVHQGDRDGAKGVYYVNTVDEVTQYEHIGCVAALSERFLLPVLEALLGTYPLRCAHLLGVSRGEMRHKPHQYPLPFVQLECLEGAICRVDEPEVPNTFASIDRALFVQIESARRR